MSNNFEGKLWKYWNLKTSLTKREIKKTISFIENKEITAYQFWGKPKNLPLKNWPSRKLVTIKRFSKRNAELMNRSLKFKSECSSITGTISLKILQQTVDVRLKHLTNAVNHTLQAKYFPDKLRQ